MSIAEQLQVLIAQHGRVAVAAAAWQLFKCKCERCGIEWTPRGTGLPSQCPRCKSIHWQTARRAQGGGE